MALLYVPDGWMEVNANRPRHEPKGSVRRNATHLHCKLFLLSHKRVCSHIMSLVKWDLAGLCTQTNPVCKNTLWAVIVLWTSLKSPLKKIQGLGCASFMLAARVLSQWGKTFIWSTHINARHVLIIIHACHAYHLHTLAARMRGGAKYETGQRSLLGILSISSSVFFTSVFLESLLIFHCSSFVLHVN